MDVGHGINSDGTSLYLATGDGTYEVGNRRRALR